MLGTEVKNQSSMFISKQWRGLLNEGKTAPPPSKLKKKGAAAIVQYDNKTCTIQDEAKRKIEALQNPLLANLSKRNSTLAFSTTAPRFNEKPVDEVETFLGPGYYE